MMALSTFFIGITINAKKKLDRWLKYLMMIHGIFFLSCFIMPMTGVFSSMSNGETSIGGVIALEFWCVYFIPIGVLSVIHFAREDR
jgi:isoprenylcysteine carboxyl methyltransferase (ICMT) family protein YpbQ